MGRGKRTRLSKGIYRDAAGIAAVVTVGLERRERRYPLGTNLKTLQAWQEHTRATLTLNKPVKPVRGTLAAAVDAYLPQIGYLSSWKERRAELRAWCALYGSKFRATLTAEHIRMAMTAWTNDGVAAKTINNRLHSLRHLFRTLDGKRAPTPCDDVAPLVPPRTVITDIDPAMVVAVVAQLASREHLGLIRSAKTRARFLVLAVTGKRPSEVMRTQPMDVDLERRLWRVRDGKGGFSAGLYLNDDMVSAWRVFIKDAAWGAYDTSAFARTIRAAGWPDGVRPYNLRHSFGMALSERGEDLADIQAMMGHRQIATTRRHYVPVLGTRLQRASEGLDGRFAWATPPSSPDVAHRDTDDTATPRPEAERSPRDDRAGGTRTGRRNTRRVE